MAEEKSAWEYLRRGKVEQAINLFEKAYAREPEAGNIIRLGIGYLWTSNYEAGFQHFRHAINTYHSPADIFHGMAGVAKWCINEEASAVDAWHKGFAAPYAVGASVVRLPLLLFSASALRPSVFAREEAEKILQERIEGPLSENWPGPLAKFILNKLEEHDLEPFLIGNLGNRRRGIIPAYRWLSGFYKAILKLGRGDVELDDLRLLLRKMSDTSHSEWSEDRNFADLLQCEEFFIARHEALLAQRRFSRRN